MTIKQVLVVRKDLHMRQGKACAQCAHASVLSVIGLQHLGTSQIFKDWLITGMTKICVSVDSEEELDSIVRAAREAGLPVFLVTDAGNTEFHGVPTKTAAAIGPAASEDIDKITGYLKLL